MLVISGFGHADQIRLDEKISEILPVDEAFRFGHFFDQNEAGDTLKLFWQVLPGYYLYRDKVTVVINGQEASLDLPDGEWRDDEIFGKVLVLEGLIEVSLSVPDQDVLAEIAYQGCAARGYCYPPQKQSLNSAKKASTPKKFPF